MGLEIAIVTVALLAVVVAVVSAPLRRARRADDAGAPDRVRAGDAGFLDDVDAVAERRLGPSDELEAAREAKYREIRDAELDFRTGKLSREDYDAIDADLRAEAIDILNRIEELRPRDA